MSEERSRPQQGEEKGAERADEKTPEGRHELAFPGCCGPMIESMKKAFSASRDRESESAGSCAAMMAQMMKSCCEPSGAEPESAPHED